MLVYLLAALEVEEGDFALFCWLYHIHHLAENVLKLNHLETKKTLCYEALRFTTFGFF